MDQRALDALKGSIAKWKGIVAGTDADYGVKNCPLCAQYWNNDCEGCPIKNHTGYGECEDTPYQEWCDHLWHSGLKANTPEKLRDAQRMLDFLMSLLPAEDEFEEFVVEAQ